MIFDDLIHFVSVIGKLTQPATTVQQISDDPGRAMLSAVGNVVKCLLQTR